MWQETKQGLYKKFEFKDFTEAFAFMTAVAARAEEFNHHPTWKNEWNTVEIWLSTHSKGGAITEKDRQLAAAIDGAAKSAAATVGAKKSTNLPQLKEVKIYTDGGSRGNPGPSAGAYVITDLNDAVIEKSGYYLGITTNNQAEYQALRRGLERARLLGATKLHVFMDSLLVVNQLKGIFKVRNRELWPIYEATAEFSKEHFKEVLFTHVPREFNKVADAEVNRILDEQQKKR